MSFGLDVTLMKDITCTQVGGCFVQGIIDTEDEVWFDLDCTWDGFSCKLHRPEALWCDVSKQG